VHGLGATLFSFVTCRLAYVVFRSLSVFLYRMLPVFCKATGSNVDTLAKSSVGSFSPH
jgi:hypothetical protein